MPLLKCSASKAKPRGGITYIINPKKAGIITVRNLFDDEDYAKQFEQTAALYGKGKGYNERKYYHFKLSCARQDNLSPQEAHKFAEEVAARLFQDYECVLATHTDTDTVHSHIIVNAVNPLNGKKLQFSPKDYVAMKDEVNRLGKEHGYTETGFRKRGKNSRTAAERKIMLNGGTSWKEELREVIVEAIGKSHTEKEFKGYLKMCYGVEITRSGKDYSYLHPQKQKPIRGERLGTNYTKSEVLRKLGKQNNGKKPTTDTGRGNGCVRGQSIGAGAVRASKGAYGRSAGSLIATSLDSIEREMQQLNFAAKCADRGTDAASEERKIERERARMESERRQRENAERIARERQQSSDQLKATIRRITEIATQIQVEVSTATARATDEASALFNKHINETADKAIAKIDELTNEIQKKATAASNEIGQVKDDIHFERGFQKFLFWVTPILLFAQTIVSVILLFR